MHPVITIFCPFTRAWAVDGWLDNLTNVRHDPTLTNLCVIIDANEHGIANKIKRFAEDKGYRSFHSKVNENWHPNETKLAIRRMRVADVHNQSKDLIAVTDGEIIIGLEDDTVFDRLESFDRLIDPLFQFKGDSPCGFVEGVQMGRWGANMVGAWQFDDIHNPKEVKTLLPKPEIEGGYEEITGGGLYGYATTRQLYLHHEYYTSSAQPWGPDVNYGVWVRRQGYRCLVDWQTVFGHWDYNKTKYPDDPDVRLAQIIYTKNKLTGKWDRTDYEPSRY